MPARNGLAWVLDTPKRTSTTKQQRHLDRRKEMAALDFDSTGAAGCQDGYEAASLKN